MRFGLFIPCDILKPFVKTIAIQEADEERSYRVLPDTSIVIGFQYKGRLCVIENNRESTLAQAGVTGLTDRYKVFKNPGSIGTVLVYFKETGARVFFKQPLHELSRKVYRWRILYFDLNCSYSRNSLTKHPPIRTGSEL
jgi:hypothetical protein